MHVCSCNGFFTCMDSAYSAFKLQYLMKKLISWFNIVYPFQMAVNSCLTALLTSQPKGQHINSYIRLSSFHCMTVKKLGMGINNRPVLVSEGNSRPEIDFPWIDCFFCRQLYCYNSFGCKRAPIGAIATKMPKILILLTFSMQQMQTLQAVNQSPPLPVTASSELFGALTYQTLLVTIAYWAK